MASTELAENGSTETLAKSDSQLTTSEPITMATQENPPPEDPSPVESNSPAVTDEATDKRWPGWPGDCVYRLIVPVLKVGSIIGRKGELIKKMTEETRARIRVLDGPTGSPDRIVLISGKEELEAPLSPAMDAVMRVFKRVSGVPESDGGAAAVAFCSIRLLVASTQAINLIGKQGSLIKSIQESTGASIRVLSSDDVPVYATSEERVVELQGEALKVQKALEAVVGHLRKFLVDHTVLPLFEKSYNTPPASQDRQVESWTEKTSMHTSSQSGMGSEYPLTLKRDSLFLDRETQLDSRLPSSNLPSYGQDHVLSGLRSSGLGRAGGPIVTQIAQTMQIPLTYAEDIIGIQGTNIAYIRRTSGAILTVQESNLPDEITVEIKGTSSQVQTAQQLIQECINNHEGAGPISYGKIDSRSAYPQLGNSSYSSSSYGGQSYGRYGSSGLGGGYSSFRM